MKYIYRILITFYVVNSAVAYAESSCIYNGEAYPEGSVIGPYICQNGTWVIKE